MGKKQKTIPGLKTASPEDKELDGKVVVLVKKNFINLGAYPENYMFKCEGGFGCKPYLRGQAIFGHLVNGPNAGKPTRIDRSDVEFVVEE